MTYLIIGDDEYLRSREESKIKDNFLSPAEIDLNYSVYSPDDINGIMDSLNTTPFMADNRVVLVKDAHQLSQDSLGTILSYAEKPVETSVLVLSADSALEGNKLYRKLSSLIEKVEAGKPNEATVKKWIRGFFKKEGIEISPEAVNLIAELKGDDTSGIKTELEKLASYSGGDRIEVEHVENLVGRSVAETVFSLVDAINRSDPKWAFRILRDLYDQKKQPHEVIGYLAWYLRTMQQVVFLSDKGKNVKEIASQIKYSPAYAKRLMAQSKGYTAVKIDRWVFLLLEADRDIKTGRRGATLALEALITSFLTS
ncbi:MAG: DNA polymerase III subunit delta [Candidatus Omnitrophota bacterium]